LEAQLKKVQEKLQQAQQNADLASNQRAALETQLKQAEDKLRQAQQNADLASSQRADFETQLKQAQDKLQRTQENAEVISSQRAALEVRLKRAEANMQVAELVDTQRSSPATKKIEYPTRQLGSGLTLPLDGGPEQGRGTFIQP
jgi:chromosome segregation ATPase